MEALHQERLTRALLSLEGLSVGDAFGERMSRPILARLWMKGSIDSLDVHELVPQLGPPPWRWTDDTALALAIVDTLREHQEINQDHLAHGFAMQFSADPRRGYGMAMHTLLPQLKRRNAWKSAPKKLFSGQGSFGNGAAMRVAPLGAYFGDDFDAAVENARRSAIVTHSHPEAVAGAIAVAVAAALAWRLRGAAPPKPKDFISQVLQFIPESIVAEKSQRAHDLPPETPVRTAVEFLGNGREVTAQDTVPFVLWSAAYHLDNFEHALWQTVSGLGDVDTTCATVGGIVVMYTGVDAIPAEWLSYREPLPAGSE